MVIDGQLRNCSAPDGHCIHKSDPLTQPAMAMTRKWYISVPWPRRQPPDPAAPFPDRTAMVLPSIFIFALSCRDTLGTCPLYRCFPTLLSPPSNPTPSHYPKLPHRQRVRHPPQPFKKPCGNRNLRSPFFILVSVSLCPTNNLISIRPVRRRRAHSLPFHRYPATVLYIPNTACRYVTCI